MIELTEQQLKAMDADPEPRLLDPRTKKTYVLVGAEVYDRLQRLLCQDDDLDMNQVAVLVERAMHEDDAGDPTLAFYQRKYGKKP